MRCVFSKSREVRDFEIIEINHDVISIWIRSMPTSGRQERWWTLDGPTCYESDPHDTNVAPSMYRQCTQKSREKGFKSETLHYLIWIHIWFWICDENKKSYIYICFLKLKKCMIQTRKNTPYNNYVIRGIISSGYWKSTFRHTFCNPDFRSVVGFGKRENLWKYILKTIRHKFWIS